jgi:hypothetical protein
MSGNIIGRIDEMGNLSIIKVEESMISKNLLAIL